MPKRRIMRLPIPYEPKKLHTSLTIGGTEVKNDVVRITYHDIVTTGTSYIEAIIRDDGTYTDAWSGGEIVKFCADFTDGTTQKFEGYLIVVEPRMERYPQIRVYAQDYGVAALRRTVTKVIETDTDIGEIAKSVIEENLSGYTTTNINTSTGTTAKPSWQNTKIWQVLKDLALKYGQNGYDFWCDYSKDWHFEAKGATVTDSYPIFYAGNILGLPRVEKGIANKRNRVTVYGKSVEGSPIFATSEDKSDQSAFFLMDEVVKNTNLTTYGRCKDEADVILASKKVTGMKGKVVMTGEIRLSAGDRTFISHPFVPIHGYYTISDIKHVVDRSFTSTVRFYEILPTTPGVIGIFERMHEREETDRGVDNTHGMLDCIVETFENKLNGSYTSVDVSNSRLILDGGATSGTWISPTLDVDYNATQAYLIVNGSNYEISEFYVSSVGGTTGTWERIYPVTLLNLITKSDRLRLKIILKSDTDHPNPSIESVHVGCK